MRCIGCGSAAVSERPERTVQGYSRFRCRACSRQFNERSAGLLNRAQYPSDIIALVMLWRLRYKLSLRDLPEMFLIRGIKGRYQPMRGFKCPHSAGRFCRGYDELRNLLRSRGRPHQHISASHCRLNFLRHTATVMAILKAAWTNVGADLTLGQTFRRELWQSLGNNSELKTQKNLGIDIGPSIRVYDTFALDVTVFYEFFQNELVNQSAGVGLQTDTFNAPAW
jgi:hypothetical protein